MSIPDANLRAVTADSLDKASCAPVTSAGMATLKRRMPVHDDRPARSPDGTKIVIITDYNIYVMNADGSNRVQLTKSSDISLYGIDGSPDGRKLVFVSERDGDDDIYVAEFATRP